MSSHLYVISNPAWPDWVKVGYSQNPQRRLAQLLWRPIASSL